MSFVDRLMLASLLVGIALGAGACALFALLPIFTRIKAMDESMAALAASVDRLLETVATLMANHKAEVNAAVEKALADDATADGADLAALKQRVDAANEKLVPPVLEPSNL